MLVIFPLIWLMGGRSLINKYERFPGKQGASPLYQMRLKGCLMKISLVGCKNRLMSRTDIAVIGKSFPMAVTA